jgi:hypothetical protein
MGCMATPLGDLLKSAGVVDDMQLNSALSHQRKWGGKLGDILVDQNMVDEITLFQAIAHQNGTTLVSIAELGASQELVHAFPLTLAERHHVFPLKLQQKTLILAVDDPKNVAALDEVQFQMRMKVHPVVARTREIEWAIRRWYHGEDAPCPPPKVRQVVDANEFKLTDASGKTIQKTVDQIRAEAMARGELRPQPAAAHAPTPTPAPRYSPANPPGDPFGGVPLPTPVPQYVTHDQFHVLQQSLDGMQQVVRFLLDQSIQKGVFTREEYMAFVEHLRRGGR